ncbi:MAG: hypothetical protein NVSMB62_16270 [Acidobacteriaceae bacterium]
MTIVVRPTKAINQTWLCANARFMFDSFLASCEMGVTVALLQYYLNR